MRNRSIAIAVAAAALAVGSMGGVAPSSVAGAIPVSAQNGNTNAPGSAPQINAATRRERFTGANYSGHGNRNRTWPPRTVAQDKRDARKRRNRLRSKR